MAKPKIAVNGCDWLKMAENALRWLEWLNMAINGWIRLLMAGFGLNGLKWLEMLRNGWKLFEIT